MNSTLAAMAAAFGTQAIVESIDSVLTPLFFGDPSDAKTAQIKKPILRLLALLIAYMFVACFDINLFESLGTLGRLATAVTVSGGTDVVNSALKFANYAKENQKNQAANSLKVAAAPTRPLAITASR